MVDAVHMARRRFAGALLVLLFCLPVVPAAAATLSASEAEVKAAFVFNFGKFVEWPPNAFPENADISICVLGNETFAQTLRRTIGDKTLHERALGVGSLASLEAAERCHILFIDETWETQMPEVLHALEGRSTLTIGGRETAAQAGAIISFKMEQTKVRFIVNNQAAERARLKISSQLLKLAVEVIGSPEEP